MVVALIVHGIAAVWIVSVLTLLAKEIVPSGSGIYSSRDRSRVDRVLVEALLN